MTRRLALPILFAVVLSLGFITLRAKPVAAAERESAAAYRYRSSQAVHWRAVALRR